MPRTRFCVVAQHLDRARQPVELDAFLARVVDLLDARRGLGLAAAVDAVHLLGAQAQRHAQRIHRRVAGADHRDALARHQRRVEIRKVARAHQVAAREELVRRQHAVQRFAGNAHEARVAGAGADEHRVEAHLGDHLLDREEAPDQRVALEAHAELAAACRSRRRSRRSAGGNRECRTSARRPARGTPRRRRPRSRPSPCPPRTPFRPDPSRRCRRGSREGSMCGTVHPALADRHVADEALEPADGDGLQRVADRAHAFALALLRAHAAADGRAAGWCR